MNAGMLVAMRASRLVSAAAAPPDPRPADGRRARRGARGLGPDRPSRRRGAQRGRRPDLRRTRAARRHPARRRLPDPADRDDRRRGRGAVPVGPARPGRRARARDGRHRGPAQGPGGAAARAPNAGVAAGRALPPGRQRLVPGRRAGPATWRSCPRRSGRPGGSRSTTSGATGPSSAGDRAARARPQGRRLVRRRGDRGLAPDLPGRPGRRRRRLLDERFERPDGFDLAAFWAESSAAYEREAPRIEVTVRIRRGPDRRLRGRSSAIGPSTPPIELPAEDPDGWRHLRLRLDWPEEVPGRLLGRGPGPRGPRPARHPRADGRRSPGRRSIARYAGAGAERPASRPATDRSAATRARVEPERVGRSGPAGRPAAGTNVARSSGARLAARQGADRGARGRARARGRRG